MYYTSNWVCCQTVVLYFYVTAFLQLTSESISQLIKCSIAPNVFDVKRYCCVITTTYACRVKNVSLMLVALKYSFTISFTTVVLNSLQENTSKYAELFCSTK